jgi:hypothetical protein
MRTVEFLDAVKRRYALQSDYAISKHFGWRISRVYEYRGGHRELDDEACVQVAQALELPPAYVMACIAEARAKDATIKKYWREAATLLKKSAAAAVATVTLAMAYSAPAPAQAAPGQAFDDLYITRRKKGLPWTPPPKRILHPVTARTDLYACAK